MIHYCEPKLTWQTWQAKYRPLIRTCIEWDQLQRPRPKVGRHIITTGGRRRVFFPWFTKGWRRGCPQKVELGQTDSVIVAPAVLFHASFMLLDSCHRVDVHKPKVLILDYIEPRPSQYCCFNDLLREWWR
jgi:hypothetical protein